ncbi:MAG TPA: carbohydrate ABC transporter permease [Actinomycetes bacterium]|nr:carbohydrate ABC transporter permease [Actinomycetes bacterium]
MSRPAATTAARRRSPGAGRARRARIGANLLGLVVFVIVAFPVYWMVISALKPGRDLFARTPQFIPTDPTLANFSRAMNRDYFWNSVLNSVMVGLGAVIVSMIVGFFAAVAIARFRFYGRKTFVVMIISAQMLPLTALVIPLFLLLGRAGLQNSLTGITITYLALTLPLTIWLLRGFVAGIPPELEEAAMVDGCTRVGAFFRIILPLVAPGLVATSVFTFIQVWNEFLLANVLLTEPPQRTVSIWLYGFITNQGIDYAGLMAGSVLIALPVVVFFVILNRKIASGLVAGAVKG